MMALRGCRPLQSSHKTSSVCALDPAEVAHTFRLLAEEVIECRRAGRRVRLPLASHPPGRAHDGGS